MVDYTPLIISIILALVALLLLIVAKLSKRPGRRGAIEHVHERNGEERVTIYEETEDGGVRRLTSWYQSDRKSQLYERSGGSLEDFQLGNNVTYFEIRD